MLRMNNEQFEFSNMFWEDTEFSVEDGIPKYYEIDNEGNMNFHYLDDKETKQFIKRKAQENPEIMKGIRYKKLVRILKIK